MLFDPPLQPGVLVRRYKRFLADIISADGAELTLHCPNTGAMLGCSEPDSKVWYSTSDNPRRKYAHTLEIVEVAGQGMAKGEGGERVGVHPGRANALVGEALAAGKITELADFNDWRGEVAVPDEKGRFDFGLSSAPNAVTSSGPTKAEQSKPAIECYVEVKSVTLCDARGVGAFPDARSERAVRHVQALQRRVAAGQRGVLLFCVQHTGVRRVRCAEEIHPEYADAVETASAAGVEVLAYGCRVDSTQLVIERALPFAPR